MKKISWFIMYLIETVCIIIIFAFVASNCFASDSTETRLRKLEKQVEVQQREIIFLYSQINYTYEKRLKEPPEMKEAINRYIKRAK